MLQAQLYVPFFNNHQLLDDDRDTAAAGLGCTRGELDAELARLEALGAIERFDATDPAHGQGYRCSTPKRPELLPAAAAGMSVATLSSQPLTETEMEKIVVPSLGRREDNLAARAVDPPRLAEVGSVSAWPNEWPDDALRSAALRLINGLVEVGRVNDAEQLALLLTGQEPWRHPETAQPATHERTDLSGGRGLEAALVRRLIGEESPR